MPYVSVQLGEEVLFVSTEDRGIGRALFIKRRAGDVAKLARAVRLLEDHGLEPAGSVFVEVGANIGMTTVAAVCRHGFDSAVVIEPAPANIHTLAINLAANGISDRVHAIKAAAADRDGQIGLRMDKRTFGSHSITDSADAEDAVMVEALTLDSLVADAVVDPAAVGLLWVDAVGSEPSVVAGASRLVKDAGVPLVVRLRRGSDGAGRDRLLRSLALAYTHAFDLATSQRVPLEALQARFGGEARSQRVLFCRA
jgi:FkbM family methyltransferase